MKKLVVMLLVVLTVLPLAGCNRPREDHLIDLPGSKTDDPSPERGPDVPTDELAVLEFCFGFEEGLKPLVNIIKTEDNGYWLNPNKHQELKEIAKESIKYCEKLAEKPGQHFPENIAAIKAGYLGVAEDLKNALTQVVATLGERNNDRLIELKDEVKAAFQDHLDIYTGYAAKYRQDMAEVVLMHDVWHFSIGEIKLAAYERMIGYGFPKSWAQEKEWPQVKEAALATLEECEKFLAKYEDKPDFPQKYAKAKDEQVARVQEMKSLMDELIGFIEEKNQKGVYYTVQPQVQKLLEEGGAARDEWTEELQSKVYLFPVVDYPEVALEYLLTLVGLEERQQLEYYLRAVKKGNPPPFGLDKLLQYSEAMQEMYFTHYLGHRFLKVHEDLEYTDPFNDYGCEIGPFPRYRSVIISSQSLQNTLRELVLAIKKKDHEEIRSRIEGIEYSYKNINSTISPYGRYRRPLG